MIQQYDDVKIGYDNNGDGDILDAGDDLQVSDNFSSNVMSLTYDNNGNPTDDGVLRYVYDGWNRLRKAQRYADGDTTTIATYSYLPDNRRASKVVEHCGIEAVANDAGDTTVHFYYGGGMGMGGMDMGGVGVSPARWNVFETRNGSNQSTRQWVWGTQYVDEVLLMDVNGDPATSNDCDPDTAAQGELGQDRRYFYHQDRNWNVVALTEYDDGAGVTARIHERYAYTPYGEFVVTKGDTGSGELGRALMASPVGNILFHQGLALDQEKGQYQNRHREYAAKPQRFAQRDPFAVRHLGGDAELRRPAWDALPSRHRIPLLVDQGVVSHLYVYVLNDPLQKTDALGLQPVPDGCQSSPPVPPGDSCFSYPPDYTYLGVSARCMCGCMPNSPWSNCVRACLLCAFHRCVSAGDAHSYCYGTCGEAGADDIVMLGLCALGCFVW